MSGSIEILYVDPFPHRTRDAGLNPMNARVNHLLNEVLYRIKEITPQGMVHFHIEDDASVVRQK